MLVPHPQSRCVGSGVRSRCAHHGRRITSPLTSPPQAHMEQSYCDHTQIAAHKPCLRLAPTDCQTPHNAKIRTSTCCAVTVFKRTKDENHTQRPQPHCAHICANNMCWWEPPCTLFLQLSMSLQAPLAVHTVCWQHQAAVGALGPKFIQLTCNRAQKDR